MKRVAVTAGLLALLGAGSAQARPFGPLELTYYRAALIYWGYGEPPNCATLTREVVPALADHYWGRATQPDASVDFGEACELRVTEEALATGHGCQLMAHEVGHLLGLSHSPDPHSVMYGGYFEPVPSFICPQVAYGTVLRWERLTRLRKRCPTLLEGGRTWKRCWRRARRLYAALN